MKKVAALLPIKYHSERVPGKNFRNLCGKPLYQWILEVLLSTSHISEVIIDTDSDLFINELKNLYPQVKVILRPENIRGDFVSMNDIIAYDISLCKEYDYFIQTHTTNPLISKMTFEKAIECFDQLPEFYDSLFSVNRIQTRTYWQDGTPINHKLGHLKRTQDLPAVYEENSNLFIFSREVFEKTKSRIGVRPFLYETPRYESLEIDEEEDFFFIQLLLESLLLKGQYKNE